MFETCKTLCKKIINSKIFLLSLSLEKEQIWDQSFNGIVLGKENGKRETIPGLTWKYFSLTLLCFGLDWFKSTFIHMTPN